MCRSFHRGAFFQAVGCTDEEGQSRALDNFSELILRAIEGSATLEAWRERD
jgi:hypothetical protein